MSSDKDGMDRYMKEERSNKSNSSKIMRSPRHGSKSQLQINITHESLNQGYEIYDKSQKNSERSKKSVVKKNNLSANNNSLYFVPNSNNSYLALKYNIIFDFSFLSHAD